MQKANLISRTQMMKERIKGFKKKLSFISYAVTQHFYLDLFQGQAGRSNGDRVQDFAHSNSGHEWVLKQFIKVFRIHML